MKAGSIRLRLLAAAAVGIAIALIVAEVGLSYLFERHVERAVDADLGVHLRQLIAAISLEGGKVSIRQQPGDPRFDQPFSGLYWQVEGSDGSLLLASRSLWDSRLTLPTGIGRAGSAAFSEITGPESALLRALVRTIEIAAPQGARSAEGATGTRQEARSAGGVTGTNKRRPVPQPPPGPRERRGAPEAPPSRENRLHRSASPSPSTIARSRPPRGPSPSTSPLPWRCSLFS